MERLETNLLAAVTFAWGSYMVTFVGSNPNDRSQVGLFDLAFDPADFLNASVDDLVTAITGKTKVIRRVRANAFPGLMPPQFRPVEIRGGAQNDAVYSARAEVLKNPEFRARVEEALAISAVYEKSPYVEMQMLDKFYGATDEAQIEQYQATPWDQRYPLVERFSDSRLTELATRHLYLHNTDLVPLPIRKEQEAWLSDRLMTENPVPWLTVPRAIQLAIDLEHEGDPNQTQLGEILDWLKNLESEHQI